MRLLAVAPYVPYEGVPHAGGTYLLRHLEALSRDHQVTLLAPQNDAMALDLDRVPDWLDLVVAPLRLEERSFGLRLQDAAYRRLLAAPPLPTAESLRALREAGLLDRAREADLVELHWPEYARLASELRRAGVRTPVSVVEHDVDLQAGVKRLREHARGYRRALGLATARLPRRWEAAGLRDADLVLVFKGEDEHLLREHGIDTPVQVIDPWVEEPEPGDPAPRPPTVLFTAAFWRRENADGADWLLREVWPAVRAAVPEARLVLAGAGPGPRLRALAAEVGGVEVTGTVPELLPYYGQADVFVAPLFVGGGLKFKVAQAMRCGLPVVATSNAAQGVVEVAPAGSLWAASDDAAQTAQALCAALRSPDEAERTGAAAAAWAAARWSFPRSMERVAARYAVLARHEHPAVPVADAPPGQA